jgi:predicted signal transduction protein with EAL and GGDEF domain
MDASDSRIGVARAIHSGGREAVIKMAHSLNLRVVAEGVEQAEELAFLREHRCDEAQGYYFSRPVPAARLVDLLVRGIPNPLGTVPAAIHVAKVAA